MDASHYALRDDQWGRIKDFLPEREGHVGGTAKENRQFIDASYTGTAQAWHGETCWRGSRTSG